MDARTPSAIYVFEGFRLDPIRMTLMREGRIIPTTPRVLSTLLYLVQNPGRTVARDEMMQALWPGRITDEANLSQAMSAVRKALASAGGRADLIVTVPGQGYRFTGQVGEEGGPERAAAEPPPLPAPSPEAVPPPQAAPPPEAAPAPPRRRSRVWMAVAAAAGLALCAGAAGIALLSHPSSRLPHDRTTVVLADLQNESGEPVFDRVVPRVLRIDLRQSPLLQVLSESRVADTLTLMEHPGAPLNLTLAREVCARSNGGAVIAPTVTRLQTSYLLTLTATDCMSGQPLVEEKQVSGDKDGVAVALDALSNRMRRELGEAQSSVTRFDVPLVAEKTGSFAALTAYSEGVWLHAHDREVEAITAFRHAVELDPHFAMAYEALYNPYYVTKQVDRAIAAISQAYALRGAASERDQLLISSHYHMFVTKDLDAALSDLQLMAQLYPNDASAWTNLSNQQNWLGRFPEAVSSGERALQLDPHTMASYSVLARALNHDNQTARALQIDELAVQRGLSGGDTRGQMISNTFILGQRAKSQQLFDQAAGTPLERDALLQESDLAFAQGQVRRANTILARADVLGRPSGIHLDSVDEAEELSDVGLQDDARKRLETTPQDERRNVYFAVAARLEPPAEVEAQLSAALRRWPQDTLLNGQYAPMTRAELDLRQGRAADAVKALDAAGPLMDRDMDMPYEKGLAQLAANDPAGAATSFRFVLGHTGFAYASPYFLAHLQLARALRRTGDLPGARKEYAAFLDAWRDADPDLDPIKQARAEYAALPAPAGPSSPKP